MKLIIYHTNPLQFGGIDTFDKTQKEKQELINYLKEKINECKLTGNDEDYIQVDAYEEILSKIEKSDK